MTPFDRSSHSVGDEVTSPSEAAPFEEALGYPSEGGILGAVQRSSRLAGSSFDLNDGLVAVALLSAAAAVIHAVVSPAHFGEWWLYGTFFVVAALGQAVWSVLVLRMPSRALLLVGAVGNIAIVVLWLTTRITGLPVGPEPWTPEGFGALDVVASVFEAVLAISALLILRQKALPERTKVHLERPQLAIFTGVVAAVTYLVVTGGGHH